jgi:hypothetical protein
MRGLIRLCFRAAVIGALLLVTPGIAAADGITQGRNDVTAKATGEKKSRPKPTKESIGSSDLEQRRAAALAAERRIKAEIAAYRAAWTARLGSRRQA